MKTDDSKPRPSHALAQGFFFAMGATAFYLLFGSRTRDDDREDEEGDER